LPGTRIDEELECDEREGMLLADQKDKVIGKDHPLDRRHGIEGALRKKEPDKKEEDADEMLPQNSQNHEASSFQILDCRSHLPAGPGPDRGRGRQGLKIRKKVFMFSALFILKFKI